MVENKKTSSLIHFLALLILFLACLLLLLLLLLSRAAAPLSRGLALRSQSSPVPEVADQVTKRELIARMELESDDYPGSGANNRHDPKSPPGRA